MKIVCIGRNYKKHVEELKNDLPSEPLFFMKPDSAILPQKMPFFIPEFTKEVHYEAELVIRINRLGKHIDPKFAHKYFNEITLGVDFTARDIQEECKKKGLPWEKAKAFDGSAVLGKFIDKQTIQNPDNIHFTLLKNDETVQMGNTEDMIFSIPELISHVSKYVTLKIGDLIFTGTPEGVGQVRPDDVLIGSLEGMEMFRLKIK